MEQDTIVAISTAPGRGGIGIVRLSGPSARTVAGPMVRLRGPLEHARARVGELLDLASGQPLDQAVATYFAAPNSYTGEDLVELALHGSPVLLEHAVRQCCAAGARLAEPGEFTRRAFLAGRIDLTQAEAIDDLIASSTLEQARLAARQLGGSLARIVAPIKQQLIDLIAALEAGIDFAEDDIDVMPAVQILAAIDTVLNPLQSLSATFSQGRILREGLRLAIVGRPNAGKSSLFNRLVQRDRAIVTATPGTTRDTISERVSLAGIPVELVDTAGLREANDEAERLGIERSRQAIAEADLVLLVVDSTAGLTPEEHVILDEHTASGRPLLTAWNKSDLIAPAASDPTAEQRHDLESRHSGAQLQNLRSSSSDWGASSKLRSDGNLPPTEFGILATSALTGAGVELLRQAIVDAAAGGAFTPDSTLLTSLRQHQAVEAAIAAASRARAAAESAIPHEMILLDLYETLRGLDALTGATTTEDVLQTIFSRFCIGK